MANPSDTASECCLPLKLTESLDKAKMDSIRASVWEKLGGKWAVAKWSVLEQPKTRL